MVVFSIAYYLCVRIEFLKSYSITRYTADTIEWEYIPFHNRPEGKALLIQKQEAVLD